MASANVTKSPSNAKNITAGDYSYNSWWDTNLVFISDNQRSYHYCSESQLVYSRILRTQGFGFSIPSNAVITGIKVEIECYRSISTRNAYFALMRLYKTDAEEGVGDNKASTMVLLPSVEGIVEFGGDSDLWGETWTPAEINNTHFGVGFVTRYSNSSGLYSYVDHVQITVYYNYTEDVTIEATTCEASQIGVVPVIRERLTAGAAQATLATGEHSISHVALSPSAGVNASGVTLALLNVLRTEVGGLSASCPDVAKLLWAVRATTAGLVAEVLDPMFVAGDWIIYATSCGLTCAVQAPTIKEIMKGVAPAGIAVDAVLPSACFSVPSGSCSISLDAADPALRQVLHAVVTEMVARADAPKILLRVPVDTCRLAASLVAPSAGYRVATETAEMSVSLFPPRILEAIRAVTAETVLEGIPARTVYDMLIRAMAAGISCMGVEPRVYCAGWDRIEQDSSVWTRIDREPSVWTRIK